MISAHPLQWPAGWPRTPAHKRERAKFSRAAKKYGQSGTSWTSREQLTVAQACERVLGELTRFGVDRQDIVISTNIPTTLNGTPRSGLREPDDPGVAVYWQEGGNGKQAKCIAIDRYDRVADNLAAISKTLEAMRGIERWGGAQILARVFTGFTALPAPGQTTALSWRDVLGHDVDTLAELEERYRVKRSRAHPDREGGSAEAFDAVQKAYEQAKLELGAKHEERSHE